MRKCLYSYRLNGFFNMLLAFLRNELTLESFFESVLLDFRIARSSFRFFSTRLVSGSAEGADARFALAVGCIDSMGEAVGSAPIWEDAAAGCVSSGLGAG